MRQCWQLGPKQGCIQKMRLAGQAETFQVVGGGRRCRCWGAKVQVSTILYQFSKSLRGKSSLGSGGRGGQGPSPPPLDGTLLRVYLWLSTPVLVGCRLGWSGIIITSIKECPVSRQYLQVLRCCWNWMNEVYDHVPLPLFRTAITMNENV